ncbi:hypothetical protein [Bernardetia sp.]|uniref:hypothetical protein n=1 Tax=Bernardetia sp. TaxID=1937974 RepID=UPI0025BB6D43|nr:hypothetical protein [Bernardetia sp.]
MQDIEGTYKLVKKASQQSLIIGLVGILLSITPYFFLIRAELLEAALYLSFFLIPFLILGLVVTIHPFIYQVTITEKSISLKLPTKKRSFSFDEIRGFRTSPGYIYIYSKRKKIAISAYTEGIDKIRNWVHRSFVNLDALPQEENDFAGKFNAFFDRHFSNLDNEENTDISLASYQKQLSRAKYVTKIYNIICVICIIWLFLYPYIGNSSFFADTFFDSYKNAFISIVVLIITGIILPKISNGFIKYSNKEDNKPYVSSMFLPLGAVLTLRVLLDINLLGYSTILLYSGMIGLLLTITVMTSKEFNVKQLKTYLQGVFFLFSFTIFGYGTIGIGNFLYDESMPKIYRAKIIKREMYSGKVITYNLRVEKWHETFSNDRINISRNKYRELEGEDSVTIYLKEGKLGIPWLIPN